MRRISFSEDCDLSVLPSGEPSSTSRPCKAMKYKDFHWYFHQKNLIILTCLFALHSRGENVQPVFSSARHIERIVEIFNPRWVSSLFVLSMFSLATRPPLPNRPRLISGLLQKEEFPDLLSLSLCHVACHLESRIDARKRHICLVFKRFTFRNEGVLTPRSLFCSSIELFCLS